MEEYLEAFKKRKNGHEFKTSSKINLKPIISKFLIAVIFFLVSVIFTNSSDKNLLFYKEHVLTESIPFTKIKGWYEDLFGEVLPKNDNNDGVDIWYGNLTNISVKLYDYVEKNKLIGETKDDKLYLVIKKNNEFIKYEDYKA